MHGVRGIGVRGTRTSLLRTAYTYLRRKAAYHTSLTTVRTPPASGRSTTARTSHRGTTQAAGAKHEFHFATNFLSMALLVRGVDRLCP